MGLALRSRNMSGHDIRPAYNVISFRSDQAQRPSPRRPRRVVHQRREVAQSSMIAKIAMLQQGGDQRPVITRGGKHLRFRFTSIKTQTTQLGEGNGDRALERYNEVAADVLDYEGHPFEIAHSHIGRVQKYRPDNVRLLSDGTIELVEVKRTPSKVPS